MDGRGQDNHRVSAHRHGHGLPFVSKENYSSVYYSLSQNTTQCIHIVYVGFVGRQYHGASGRCLGSVALSRAASSVTCLCVVEQDGGHDPDELGDTGQKGKGRDRHVPAVRHVNKVNTSMVRVRCTNSHLT